MKKIIIFGYGSAGIQLFLSLENSKEYMFIGFADNSIYKQGMFVDNIAIRSVDDLAELKAHVEFSVIIASNSWFVIGEQLASRGIAIEGIYQGGGIVPYAPMNFARLDLSQSIKFYAGDICDEIHMADKDLYGLSISKTDNRHIYCDITNPYPLPDNCICGYQSEHVFEHIPYSQMVSVLNEIYRILKPGAVLRMSMPDYNAQLHKKKAMYSKDGILLFDADGGGTYGENGVSNGGHVWFPTFENVKVLLSASAFDRYEFFKYCTEEGNIVNTAINYQNGYTLRSSNDKYGNEILVDCYKV